VCICVHIYAAEGVRRERDGDWVERETETPPLMYMYECKYPLCCKCMNASTSSVVYVSMQTPPLLYMYECKYPLCSICINANTPSVACVWIQIHPLLCMYKCKHALLPVFAFTNIQQRGYEGSHHFKYAHICIEYLHYI